MKKRIPTKSKTTGTSGRVGGGAGGGSRIPTFPAPTLRPTPSSSNGGIPVSKFGFTGGTRTIPRPPAAIPTFNPNATYHQPQQALNNVHDHTNEPPRLLIKPTSLNTTTVAPPSRQGHYSGGSGSEDGYSTATTPNEILTPVEEEFWKRSVGKRVTVGGVKTGTLLYFGKVHFANGFFCGLKLDEPEGRHDGSLEGVRYYTCPPSYGIFAPYSKVCVCESPIVALPPIRNSYSAGAMDTYSQQQFELSSGANRSRLPAPKTLVGNKNNQQCPRRDTDALSSTFVAELTSPPRYSGGKMRQSASLNSTFVNGNGFTPSSHDSSNVNRTFSGGDNMNYSRKMSPSPNGGHRNSRRASLNQADTTVTITDINHTFQIEEEVIGTSPCSTFNLGQGTGFPASSNSLTSTPSPKEEGGGKIGAKDDLLYEVPEDDADESSLGLLSPSQMLDFSVGTDIGISIPKTHSCDDINDLPEEEVVENITVEYTDANVKSQIVSTRFPGDTPAPLNKPLVHHRLSSTPVGKGLDSSTKVRPPIHNSPIMGNVSFEGSTMDESLSSTDSLQQKTFAYPTEDCSMLEDQQITLVDMTWNRSGNDSIFEDKADENSIQEQVREHLMSSRKPEQLASVLKEGSVGEALLRTLKDVDLEKLGQASRLSKEREAVLVNAARYEEGLLEPKDIQGPPPQVVASASTYCPMTKSVEWSTDVVDIFRKSRLVSSTGSIGNSSDHGLVTTDDHNRVSIEKVMEVIQREGELYKHRPASTFTVGSADTGYQGDGEFDLHSEIGTTAGSPSEEAKYMSVCSQDSAILNTDNEADNNKLIKSGHMSDSDFFTDQGGNSEMENDADLMKRSMSSSTGDGTAAKCLTGIAEDEDDTLLGTGGDCTTVLLETDSGPLTVNETMDLPREETTNTTSSSDLQVAEQQLPQPKDESSSISLDIPSSDSISKEAKDRSNSSVAANESRNSSSSTNKSLNNVPADSRKPSSSDGGPDAAAPPKTRQHPPLKNPKKNIVVSKPAPVKVVGVSKIKSLLEKSPTPEEMAARRAARTPKKSRWDSVTSKISDDKDKPKVKREIKSRVNTNLAGARQAAKVKTDSRDNDNSEASGHQTPSSKSQTVTGATDSLLPRDPPSHCSSRGTDDVADCNLEPSCASTSTSNKALSYATSETGSVFHPPSEVAASEKSVASSYYSQAAGQIPKRKFESRIYRFQPLPTTGNQSKASGRATSAENIAKKPPMGKFVAPVNVPAATNASSRTRVKAQISDTAKPKANIGTTTKTTTTTTQSQAAPRGLPWQRSMAGKSQKVGGGATARAAAGVASSAAAPSTNTELKPGSSLASTKKMAPRDVNQNRSRGNATVASSVGTVSSSTRIRSAQVTANKVEELSKEVQRLGALCEARTKELNMVKMQTKHTALGFDAFGVLVKYLVGELDAFSHPDLVADIQKTKEELITLESVLKQYEADVEQMKTTHSDKLNSLTEELKRSEAEILSLNNKLNDADAIRAKEVHDTVENYEFKAKEIQQMHLHSVENLKISHQREIEGLELQLKEKLEEALKRHEAEKDDLKAQIEVQKKKFLSMEQTAKAFEETLNKDTDAKIQWISAKNQELQQEVDSLKSVLDMKQQEIHALRAENMKMKKGLEELPLERHRVMKLQARNEELQALVRDKVKSEKKLSCEHRRLKEYLEQEEKFKQQLTMENEELQWKIKHSFDGSSFLNATVDGNVISLIASTPEVAEKFKNLRAMSFNPLSPFRESYEKSSPMQTSIACLEDAKKTFRNSKPKPRRPSKSCSASPRKSPSRHHLASAFVASTPGTPSAHCCHKVLDLSKLDDRGELDETLDMSGTSSRSLESPQESLTELHFKACLHIDAMEEMAQMTNTGLDPGATRALLQSPDGMSSDSGGPGGCSSLASSSVAEDGMSASVSSVEPDDKDLLAMTAESSFYSVCSPRNEARDSPFNPNAANGVNGAISPEPVESLNSVTTTSTCTNSKNSNATSYEPCFCDDFDINSEPE